MILVYCNFCTCRSQESCISHHSIHHSEVCALSVTKQTQATRWWPHQQNPQNQRPTGDIWLPKILPVPQETTEGLHLPLSDSLVERSRTRASSCRETDGASELWENCLDLTLYGDELSLCSLRYYSNCYYTLYPAILTFILCCVLYIIHAHIMYSVYSSPLINVAVSL